jgi:hypothetical protein
LKWKSEVLFPDLSIIISLNSLKSRENF